MEELPGHAEEFRFSKETASALTSLLRYELSSFGESNRPDSINRPRQFSEQVNLAFSTTTIAGLDIDLPEALSYFRVNKSLTRRLAGHQFIELPGMVLKENVTTMRTEGVVVDRFLGSGGDPPKRPTRDLLGRPADRNNSGKGAEQRYAARGDRKDSAGTRSGNQW